MSEQVKVACDHCGQSYRVRQDKLGQTIRCRKCQQEFVLQVHLQAEETNKAKDGDVVAAWHVSIDKASKGPFSTSQVISLINDGKATSETLVWKTGMQDWQPASALPEFSGCLPSAVTPAPPEAGGPPAGTETATKRTGGGLLGLFGTIKEAVSSAAQQVQKQMSCTVCGARMGMYEQAARMGMCAKCALVETGLTSSSEEGFVFSQAATYKGGLPDHIEPSKRSGFAFVYEDRFIFFDDLIRWSIPFENIIRAELDTFQPSGARAVLAGFNAVALKQVRNTLTVTFLDENDIEQTARFQIHGAATIPGEEIKANEFLSHLNRFKSQFGTSIPAETSAGGEDVEARLEKLQSMREKGLITEGEYEQKRSKLIELL